MKPDGSGTDINALAVNMAPKSSFVRKILCPSHEEKTPSCAVYADGSGYCFSCSKYFKTLEGIQAVEETRPPENIEETLQYIRTLPTMPHRGLIFHYDKLGYYILWPKAKYYKRRNWAPESEGNKYTNPSGIPQPWLLGNIRKTGKAIIIEGEINALSVMEVNNTFSVYCPGSAGQFKLNKSGLSLQHFSVYAMIILIADKDSAGAQAVIKLKKELVQACPDIRINLIKPDYNEILDKHGKETLKEEIKKLGLP